MPIEEVLTVHEVAEYLRVNPQTVYRKAKAGELPALRIGRAIRFRRGDLDAWLSSMSLTAPSGARQAGLDPRNAAVPLSKSA